MLRELACGGVAVARRFAAQVRALTRGERLGDAALSSGNVWARPAHECGRQLRAVLRTLGFAAQGCRYRSAVLRRLRRTFAKRPNPAPVGDGGLLMESAMMLAVGATGRKVLQPIVGLDSVQVVDAGPVRDGSIGVGPDETVLKEVSPARRCFHANHSVSGPIKWAARRARADGHRDPSFGHVAIL